MPIGPALIYQIALGDGAAVKVVQDRADALPAAALDGDVFLSIKPEPRQRHLSHSISP